MSLCVSCGALKPNTHIEVEELDEPLGEKQNKTTVLIDNVEVIEGTKEEKAFQNLREVTFLSEKYLVPPVKNNFQIGVFLPFMASHENHKLTNAMLDYLEGIQLATKELSKLGMKVTVKVFDTEKSKKIVKKQLEDLSLVDFDLIIGPVFKENIQLMENHCATYHIPLVIPLKYYQKTAQTNFPLYNVFPTDSILYQSLGQKIAKTYPTFKISTIITEEPLNILARKHFNIGYKSVSNKEVNQYTTANVKAATSLDTSVIFIPSTIVADVRFCLDNLKKTKKVKVLGLDEWQDFMVNDYPMWNDLNVHFGTKFNIQYSDTIVKELKNAYHEEFVGEPSKYFYIAYDEWMFFGEALFAFGRNFPKFIKNREFPYLHNNFKFVEKMGYYENESINLIQFKEFQVCKIKN